MKVIDSVMNSLSSSQQNEVKAWEQEMIACEHTLTLQQASSKNLESQGKAEKLVTYANVRSFGILF